MLRVLSEAGTEEKLRASRPVIEIYLFLLAGCTEHLLGSFVAILS